MVFFAAFGFVATLLYLIDFFRFASEFRRAHPDVWRALGCPESFGLRGQATYLSIVLGVEKGVPSEIAVKYRQRFLRLRVLLGAALVSFVVLAVLTG